jgi:enoyl-CoA hydratase/carnithine racemase
MTTDETTSYECITYAVLDHVLTIELNRPDSMNAVTVQMREEIIQAFAEADADPDVRVIVITGKGRAYCAGADVSGGAKTFAAAEAGWGPDIEEFRDGGGRIALQIFRCTKPVIGAINGVAAGLGATMLLPMDLLLAADTVRIGFVFAKRGLVPEACATWFLPKRVGISKAAEWCYTGRLVSAEEALAAGLLRSVHPAAELLPAAYALAREIADNAAPVAVGMMRQMLWRFAGSADPMDAHRVDSKMNYVLGQSPDVAEGIQSFLDKRQPQFPGRLPADAPSVFPWWEEPEFRSPRD